LAHPDPIYFIHQHVVDAYTAQTANETTKPIALTFSLAGLYLFSEQGYSGRQVQQAHMAMAKNKETWPLFQLPKERGSIVIQNVLAAPPGDKRDIMIKKWSQGVWQAFSMNRPIVQHVVALTLERKPK
jgi:hypothetical protein